MDLLPLTNGTLLIRTDFTQQPAWESLVAAARTPSEPDGFGAGVDIVDDSAYRDLSADQLRELLPPLAPYHAHHVFFFMADRSAMSAPEHPMAVVPVPFDDPELDEEPREEFRVAVSALWSVENNLRLANMDWGSFASGVDDDGVLRGFY
jgi:hypothetical protein